MTPAFLACAIFPETGNREEAEEKTTNLILDMLSLRFFWDIQVEMLHKELNILEFKKKLWTRGMHLEGCIKLVIKAMGMDDMARERKCSKISTGALSFQLSCE